MAISAQVVKTPGQLAYERDLDKMPTYRHLACIPSLFSGNDKRPIWENLSEIGRLSWERNAQLLTQRKGHAS